MNTDRVLNISTTNIEPIKANLLKTKESWEKWEKTASEVAKYALIALAVVAALNVIYLGSPLIVFVPIALLNSVLASSLGLVIINEPLTWFAATKFSSFIYSEGALSLLGKIDLISLVASLSITSACLLTNYCINRKVNHCKKLMNCLQKFEYDQNACFSTSDCDSIEKLSKNLCSPCDGSSSNKS